MPDHLRQQIRSAAVAALKAAALPPWAARVYASRRVPLAETDLPALCVYTTEEDSVLDAGRHLRRGVSLVIEAITQDNVSLDDDIDALALSVEKALAADRTLGGLAYDTVLMRTTIALQPVRDAKNRTGSAVLAYAVTYRTPVADPSLNSI